MIRFVQPDLVNPPPFVELCCLFPTFVLQICLGHVLVKMLLVHLVLLSLNMFVFPFIASSIYVALNS